jgi:hypothetical protein
MRQELSSGGLARERSPSQIENRIFKPPEHCQFQNPDRGNPNKRKGDLEEFLWEENFPIGNRRTSRNPKNTEPDRAQKTCEVEMSFFLVRISYKRCGLFMKFNGLTILNWIAQCMFRIQ